MSELRESTQIKLDQIAGWLAELNNQKKAGNLTEEQYQIRLARTMTAQELWNERLRKKAYIDKLTELPNRRYLDQELDRQMNRARRSGQALGLLRVDLNNFKEINDTRGHEEGDNVLKKIATVMQTNVRLSDFVGRFGGDEFEIVAYDPVNNGLTVLAEKIRDAAEKAKIDVSIGGAYFKPEDNTDSFRVRVDAALYQAKQDKIRGKSKAAIGL